MPAYRLSTAAALVGLAALPLAGCSSSGSTASDGATSDGGQATTVMVTASDDACELSASQVPAGTTMFNITNTGDKTTEVYVYGTDDKIIEEKEGIGPGLDVSVSADLEAGSYEIACKPGETGDGIRSTLTVG